MDMTISTICVELGLVAKLVILTLTVMSVSLVVVSILSVRRWRALTSQLRDLEAHGGSADTPPSQHLQREVIRSLGKLDQGVATLGSLTWGAPLVGFFGTVVGLVNGLTAVAAMGQVGSAVLSSGIAEALMTLLLGLGVAMAAGLGFTFFRACATRLRLRATLAFEELSSGCQVRHP
jgi:biopolymer transport protein ExbB/TolQ